MDDLQFDELMRTAGAVPQVRASLITELAEESRTVGRPIRRRRLRVVAVAVSGVVLLAAATSTAALMKVPPFQSLPTGLYRTQASIAVDYRSITGQENHCLAFLEFLNLSVKQADAANTLVEQHDWSGIGQRSYDTAVAGRGGAAAIDTRFTDVLGDELHTVAIDELPGIVPNGIDANGRAAWNGWSIYCKGGQH